MRFVEERKQSDIAGEIGVSQVHVSRLIKQALVALRDLSDRDVVGSFLTRSVRSNRSL